MNFSTANSTAKMHTKGHIDLSTNQKFANDFDALPL